MDARTRVLAADFALAGGATGVGALGAGGSPVWNGTLALFGGVVLVACLYLAEQTPVLALVENYSPGSFAAAFVVTLAVGLVLVLGWTIVYSPAASLLLGMGVGLGGYRVVYGVIAPIPDTRLAEYDGLGLDPPR